MRTLVLSIFLASTLSASAQQSAEPKTPSTESDWQNIEVPPVGTSIYVNAKSRDLNCTLKSVDSDALTCTQAQDVVVKRAEIQTVKMAHRGRSAVLGMAIGGAVGVVAAEAAWNSHWSWNGVNRGSVAAYVGVPFAGIGALVGYFTDFTRSTIYRAK